jgi:hypothetical protein
MSFQVYYGSIATKRTQKDIGALEKHQRCMQIVCSGNWKLKCQNTGTNAGKDRIEMESALTSASLKVI